jgi:hypothetical protein
MKERMKAGRKNFGMQNAQARWRQNRLLCASAVRKSADRKKASPSSRLPKLVTSASGKS